MTRNQQYHPRRHHNNEDFPNYDDHHHQYRLPTPSIPTITAIQSRSRTVSVWPSGFLKGHSAINISVRYISVGGGGPATFKEEAERVMTVAGPW